MTGRRRRTGRPACGSQTLHGACGPVGAGDGSPGRPAEPPALARYPRTENVKLGQAHRPVEVHPRCEDLYSR